MTVQDGRVKIMGPEDTHGEPVSGFLTASFNTVSALCNPDIPGAQHGQGPRNLRCGAKVLVIVSKAVMGIQQSPFILQAVIELGVSLIVCQQWRYARQGYL